ncbi:PAS domain-containing protein [Parasulfitobacter algicola]|uniref:PAS domain-containing protein n=1 Tax=Parasulfitobacter algicola TaxID=2614809 RepID=A0ABX2IJV3_9RHOB|nr:PAS domain-containing protein [Sulfitobacter algicola]NSX53192.1 PAS domain-containing protein [Sulfitobacter algicola]
MATQTRRFMDFRLSLSGIDSTLSDAQIEEIEQVFDASTDCVKLLSHDGNVVAINDIGVNLLELDERDTVLGQKWWAIWPESAHAAMRDAVGCAVRGASMRFHALRETRKGNDRKWDVSVSPICSDAGDVVALMVISQDITANLSHTPKS